MPNQVAPFLSSAALPGLISFQDTLGSAFGSAAFGKPGVDGQWSAFPTARAVLNDPLKQPTSLPSLTLFVQGKNVNVTIDDMDPTKNLLDMPALGKS
jgi:hypothetical protein